MSHIWRHVLWCAVCGACDVGYVVCGGDVGDVCDVWCVTLDVRGVRMQVMKTKRRGCLKLGSERANGEI